MAVPPQSRRKQKVFNWISCDKCCKWFHFSCAGVKRSLKQWQCVECEEMSRSRIVAVAGDGRCFFRSLATAMNPQLQVEDRFTQCLFNVYLKLALL